MKTEWVEVQSFSGKRQMQIPAKGEMIEFDRDAEHGDWKTAIARGGWPTISKGTQVEVVGWMQNFYGVFVRVKHDDYIYDVEDYKVKGLR